MIDPDRLSTTFDVGSTGDGTAVNYRVLVTTPRSLPGGTPVQGMLVAALPTTDVDDTLRRLVTVEVVPRRGRRWRRRGWRWWLAGVGLRPLRRIEDTAPAIAAGDLRQRVEPGPSATEIVRLGDSLNTMLGRIEDCVRRQGGQRGAPAAVRGRRLARAAHAAHLHPRLRRAVPAGAGRRSRERWPEHGPHRGRGRAAWAGWSTTCCCWPGSTRVGPLERAPVDLATLAADAVHDAAAVDPSRAIVDLDAPRRSRVDGDRERLTQVLVNLLANARTHTPAGTPVDGAGDGRRRSRRRGRRGPRPGHPRGRAGPGLRPLPPHRPVALARPAVARARAWPSSTPSCGPTVARSTSTTPRAVAPRSGSRCR